MCYCNCKYMLKNIVCRLIIISYFSEKVNICLLSYMLMMLMLPPSNSKQYFFSNNNPHHSIHDLPHTPQTNSMLSFFFSSTVSYHFHQVPCLSGLFHLYVSARQTPSDSNESVSDREISSLARTIMPHNSF